MNKRHFALALALILITTSTFLSIVPVFATGSSSNALPAAKHIITASDLTSDTKTLVNAIKDSDICISLLASNTTTHDAYARLALFNPGIQELETRGDAANVLLEVYSNISASFIKSASANTSEPVYPLDLLCLAILLSEPVYNNELTEAERIQLSNVSQSLSNVYTTTYATHSAAPRSGIWDWLSALVNGYTISSTPAVTLDGHQVDLLVAYADFPAATKTSYQEQTLSQYPNIIANALPTKKYNCHSFAWYEQSSANQYWINDITHYINDLHITRVPYAVEGAICVYYDENGNPVHSAVVTEVNGSSITCQSKWGALGLYTHDKNDVPSTYMEYGTTPHCLYFIYPSNHTYVVTTTTGSTHTVTCNICNTQKTEAHKVYVSRYDSAKHYLRCSVCSWANTESHIMNTITNKCKTCGYSGPTALDSILPDDDHCCGS